MKYCVGYLLGEEINKYNSLIEDISSRFNITDLIKKDRILHITFKAPFERHPIEDIEKFLKNFTLKQPTSKMFVKGFGHFDRKVIFLDVKPSTRMELTFHELLAKLRRFHNISWEEYDNADKNLHMPLIKGEIKGDIEDRFEEIWDYLSNTDFYYYAFFDNITLFKKDKGKTLVHRIYYLRS